MYETFYEMREKPFGLSPDPAYLYLSRRHRHALTMLEYAVTAGSGFALVTGEIGCGKTILVNHMVERVGRQLSVGLISNTHANFGPLLPWVVNALGIDAKGATALSDLHRLFVGHLKREHDQGRRALIVIDEAQNLDLAALEELRVLSNLNTGRQLFLQTILIGQPELRAMLSVPSMRQFAQRIAVDHHLEALRPEETREYVRHRLVVAGARPDLIAADAIDLVHDWAAGVPRLVNLVCETALIYGFADQVRTVDSQIVEQVLQDREAGGLVRRAPAASPPVNSLLAS